MGQFLVTCFAKFQVTLFYEL